MENNALEVVKTFHAPLYSDGIDHLSTAPGRDHFSDISTEALSRSYQAAKPVSPLKADPGFPIASQYLNSHSIGGYK